MNDKELSSHFRFGDNWAELLKKIDANKLDAAIGDIRAFVGGELTGRSFLDIGCGSGLSSMAAYRLGASRITSVDIDHVNIENTQRIRKYFSVPPEFPWVMRVASIVDPVDCATLPASDVVYAWGVLHHTGAMWQAISNSAALINPGGVLYLMLYRDAAAASTWKAIKHGCVRSPRWIQFLMRNTFAAVNIAGMLAKGKNPLRSIRAYGQKSRGMSWYVDVTDWVGGYPFEYAEAEEVMAFVEPLGFKLRKIYPSISPKGWGIFGTGSYEYLFEKVR